MRCWGFCIVFTPICRKRFMCSGSWTTETTFGTRLRLATGVVVALALVVPGLVYLGWRNRYALETRVVGVVVPLIRRVAGFLPVFSAPTEESVESRIGHFFGAIERVATDRTGIALALAASTVGWVLQMVALYLAFIAIDQPVPFSAMLFVVPMGAIAGVTPLPGGAGGIEAVLVAVLAALPSVSVPATAALGAVVIYRGAVYWVPVIIGGTVVSVIGVDSVG